MELDEDLIGHFGGKRLVRLRLFEEMKRGRVIQIGLVKNKRLPDVLVGQIPQVFRGQRHLIDGFPMRVSFLNDMLFDSSHCSSSSPPAKILPINSCWRFALRCP